ncbi:MAG: hypothetical protein COA78_14030 [Blastopirellula sp.]|nr:MAG: hypothetical protein COA78_14030 [Blastopirellula sp.]
MGGKVTPDGGSTIWNNQKIGFCCDGCLPDWEKLSEDQKTEKIAKAESNPDDQIEHDHEGHQHDDSQHIE